MYKAILPECCIDTCLVNTLLGIGKIDKDGTAHIFGCSTVATKMQRTFNDSFSVGIIDKDKREIDYLKDFDIINDTIKDYALLHKNKKNNKHHYIIQLYPASETWICNVSKALGIRLKEEHNLPEEPIELKKLTGKISSKEDIRFKKLFKDIVKRAEEDNFEPVLKLKDWLNKLAKDNYKVDVNELMK